MHDLRPLFKIIVLPCRYVGDLSTYTVALYSTVDIRKTS